MSEQEVPGGAVFAALDHAVDEAWARAMQGPFWQFTAQHGLEPYLGLLTLVEQYHLVRHNATNQAVAAYPLSAGDDVLLKWCLRHAREELGHEHMITRDLEAYGALELARPLLDRRPLPATQSFIGYLYHLALSRGAIARLGYSYWAEQSYPRFNLLIDRLRTPGGMDPRRDFSFFNEHSNIDARHTLELKEVIAKVAPTASQVADMIDVARTTIWLQNAIFDNCLQEYLVELGTPRPEFEPQQSAV